MARFLTMIHRWALAALIALAPAYALAQPPKPAYVTGSPTTGHCASWSGPQSLQDATCATAANPTATASDTAVNGSASTYMRSDAAPAVQKGSSSAFGVVKVDGTTITESGGVISAVGGGIASYSVTASGSSPTMSVSGITGVGGTLEITIMGRGTGTGTFVLATVTVNGLTTSIYSLQRMFLNGAGTPSGDATLNTTGIGGGTSGVFQFPTSSSQANQFTDASFTINGYSNTSMWKAGNGFGRTPNSTTTDSSYVVTYSFQIDTTAAITSLSANLSSGNWAANSYMVVRVLP